MYKIVSVNYEYYCILIVCGYGYGLFFGVGDLNCVLFVVLVFVLFYS